MVELYLKHGRDDPAQDLDDWGFDGPRLQNCTGIHQTYGTPANIFFQTEQDRDAARALTGWEVWDQNGLTVRWQDDLVVANGKFYGDWGIWVEIKNA
jgi:hypothetical protein